MLGIVRGRKQLLVKTFNNGPDSYGTPARHQQLEPERTFSRADDASLVFFRREAFSWVANKTDLEK